MADDRAPTPSPLAPSPAARWLLALGERGADGTLDLGERRLRLRAGDVVDVSRREGDEPFAVRLVAEGKLSPEDAEAAADRATVEGRPVEHVLREMVAAPVWRNTRRSLWIDWLVDALEREPERAEPGAFRPEPALARDAPPVPGESVVGLVLDALAAQAARSDEARAERLGTLELVWEPSTHRESAAVWCGFPVGDPREPVALAPLLWDTPAATPRVVALARAGIARIRDHRSHLPSPPPRPLSHVPPPPRTPPAPPRHPALSTRGLDSPLGPGGAGVPDSAVLPTPLHRFREYVGPFDDPLDDVERRIRRLEEGSAPGAERAAAWREAARLWQSRHRCLEEAARAFREATAADPTDAETAAQTALSCVAAARPDLAVAYARAAAGAARGAAGEARIQELAGRLAWRRGELEEAADAYRAALDARGDDPEPAEGLAWLLWALGEDDQAITVTRLAADRQPDTPEGAARARSLLATAFLEHPEHAELARDYATSLADEGRHEATVAVLAYAARHVDDPEARAALWLAAAERAETVGLPALAADSLLLAFDDEPFLEGIYEPLLSDLEASGAALDRALVLEEIAHGAMPEDRGGWLRRAAEARLDLPGDRTWAIELAVRALAEDPSSPSSRALLRDLADGSGDPARLPEAIEAAWSRAVTRHGHGPSTDALLVELASLAESRLSSARRAHRCWEQVAARAPGDTRAGAERDRLRETARDEENRLAEAERDLAAHPSGPERTRHLRRVVALLRDAPDGRERAATLLRELLTAAPRDAASARQLELLHALDGDEDAWVGFLRERAALSTVPADRARLWHLVAALEAARGRWRACAECADAILRESPGDAEAAARLERAARRLHDATLLRRALRLRAAGTPFPLERMGLSIRLAERLEIEGDLDEAWRVLDDALAEAPTPPEALLFAAPRLAALPPETAQRAIAAARHVFGESAHLLAHVVDGTGELDDEVRDEAFATWRQLAPRDPERAARWLAWCTRERDAAVLREAIADSLATPGASSADALYTAVARLGALAGGDDAATVAQEALDKLGDGGRAWNELVLDLAQGSGREEVLLGALERVVVRVDGRERLSTLDRIAAIHRERGDAASEARALLRTLSIAPDHGPTLERLSDLYAEAGQAERLLAVLSLRLEAARSPEERRERLLDLAAASANQADDAERAADYLRLVAEEAEDDEAVVALAAGGLVSLGLPRDALALLVARAADDTPGDAPEDLREEARRARRVGFLMDRAVHVAERVLGDPALAVATAAEGLRLVPQRTSLLLAVERVSLETGDVGPALDVYRDLVERSMGRHGRRALLYRKARFLEQAGDAPAALETYREAFRLGATDGILYRNLVRLASSLGAWAEVVDAATRLSDRAPSPAAFAAHRRRAARASEVELGDPERAFELLFDAWERDPNDELEGELRRLARVVAASAPGDGVHPVVDRLALALRERARRAFDPADRVALLERVGRLYAEDHGRVDLASLAIEEALEAADAAELDGARRAASLCLLAEWLASAGRLADARARLAQARAEDPGHARAQALDELLEVEGEGPSTGSFAAAPFGGAAMTPPTRQRVASPALGQETWGSAPPSAWEPQGTPAYTRIAFDGPLPRVDVAGSGGAPTGPADADALEPAAEGVGRDTEPADAPTLVEPRGVDAAGAPPSPPPARPSGLVPRRAGRATESGREPSVPRAERPGDTTPPPANDGFVERPTPRRASAVFTPVPAELPSAAPSDAREGALRLAAAEGDLDAAEQLAMRLAVDGDRLPDAERLLRSIVRRDPSRLAAVRLLQDAARRLDRDEVASVAAEILALVDPRERPPEPVPGEGFGRLVTDVAGALTDQRLLAPEALLRTAWETGGPLFRKTTVELGLLGTDRLAPIGPRPLARALAEALEVLQPGEVSTFVLTDPARDVQVLPTSPPGVAFAARLDDGDDAVLRFRVARGLELTQPEHVLISTRDEVEGRRVVDALRAAFGPAGDETNVPQEAASLAADLWHTVPQRDQARLKALVAGTSDARFSYERLRDEAFAAGARAGLLVAGSVAAALRGLALDDPTLRGLALDEERDWKRACERSAALRALVHFAFSDAYLDARRRWGGGAPPR